LLELLRELQRAVVLGERRRRHDPADQQQRIRAQAARGQPTGFVSRSVWLHALTHLNPPTWRWQGRAY
jgi:hypothetical protein